MHTSAVTHLQRYQTWILNPYWVKIILEPTYRNISDLLREASTSLMLISVFLGCCNIRDRLLLPILSYYNSLYCAFMQVLTYPINDLSMNLYLYPSSLFSLTLIIKAALILILMACLNLLS